MYRNCSSQARLQRTARTILALLLLTVLLSGSLPFTSVSATSICNLACCAGKAPHAAGSCMGGSCHDELSNHSTHDLTADQETETLCGVPKHLTSLKSVPVVEFPTIEAEDTQDTSSAGQVTHTNGNHFSVSSVETPCRQDCGGGAFNSSNSKRPSNPGIVSQSNPLRPQSSVALAQVEFNRTQTLAALCLKCSPRAPPVNS